MILCVMLGERTNMGLNRITIMGRLTANPSIRMTASNKAVASFTVAVDRDYDREKTDFFDVTVWEGKARFVEQHFTKGQLIVVSGRMERRTYEDKHGDAKEKWEIKAEELYFGGDKKKDGETASPKRVDASTFEDLPDDFDAELPF